MADVFGHLHRHARVVEANDLEAGRQLELEQGIDACADVEQGLQSRLLVDELLRWCPDDGMVCLRCAGSPGRDRGLGEGLLHGLHPGFRRQAGKTDGDVHGLILSARPCPRCRTGEYRRMAFAGRGFSSNVVCWSGDWIPDLVRDDRCEFRRSAASVATLEAHATSLSSSAPSVTWSPGAYSSSATVPSWGALMVCSIFMASITARA